MQARKQKEEQDRLDRLKQEQIKKKAEEERLRKVNYMQFFRLEKKRKRLGS